MTDTQESLSSLNDASFVILGQSSLSSEVNEEVCKAKNFDSLGSIKNTYTVSEPSKSTTSDTSQRNCFTENNFSEESIQKKLDELVKENYQLKETLSQNNLAIKSQLDIFFMWQQDVLKTHESHKQKFLETKDLILKLRADNISLKKQLEDFMSGVSFSNDTELYAQINKKPEDLNSLKQKVKEYEKVNGDLIEKNEEIKMENQKLKEDLESAKMEVLKLNKELEDLGREKAFLKQMNDKSNENSYECLSHKSLPNSEARAQITNLFKQLEEEKAKVLKLKQELKNIKSSNAKPSVTKLSATEEINEYIDKLNDINVSLDNQNQRFNSLKSWVSFAEENVKENNINEGKLICEINEVKTHLNQEGNVSREKQESLDELKKQFYRLLEDYKTLQQRLNLLKNNDQNIEEYKEEISSLSAKLEAKNTELALKQQECDILQEDVKKLNLECEEVALLRVQVDLYRSDFNDERAAREKIAGEKEELLERIRLLESEMECFKSQNSKTKNDSQKRESPKKKTYLCPKCMFSFSDYKDCEQHVEDCLNTLFYP